VILNIYHEETIHRVHDKFTTHLINSQHRDYFSFLLYKNDCRFSTDSSDL
jgi:hypothetical protein